MGVLNSVFQSPYLGLGLGGVGTGISTAAAYNDARAQNLANEFNASQLQQQAQLSRIQAANYRQLGEVEAADTLREYESLRGAQRAAYGASGVSVNAGSAADVQANTAAEGVYESQKSRYSRALDAWQKDVEATNLEGKSGFTLANKTNPYISAATAALTGTANMYSTYSNWKK